MKGAIIYNSNKELALELKDRYLKFFKEKNIEIVSEEKMSEVKFVVVIGGDGTLLRASKKIMRYQNIDVFAVNAGSLGFLTEIKMKEFEEIFEKYLVGDIDIEERHLLSLKLRNEEFEILNEVVISKETTISKILNISVNIETKKLCKYKADGVIVATATGSTAYSMSAGGPIVMPELKVFVITPLAPHNLTTRPIVVSGEKKLTVTIDKNQKGCIIIDGDIFREIDSSDRLEIRYSSKKLRLIQSKSRNYYSILRNKLKWGDNLC